MDGLIEICVCFGILLYFFNSRVSNMMDTVSTRLQEVYAKWERRTEIKRNPELNRSQYSIGVHRQHLYKKRQQEREQVRQIRENSLFKIKETEALAPCIKEKSSFLYYCCSNCTPASRDSLVNSIKNQHMPFGLNILIVTPGTTLFSKVFNHISHIYNFKNYEYPKVTQTVLQDERLKEAINLAACETVNNEGCNENLAFTRTKDRAKAILLYMESRLSNVLLKITSWLVYKLLPCFLESAIILPSQIQMLKDANDTGLPLIFLPLHRSHLDYVILSFILLSNDIKSPLIAAGDNLKIPLFGWFLRGLGAFFIKRRIDPVVGQKDILYRATLHTYIIESLRVGHNIEFFIEGGRTRSGKPCMPKGGILSVILDAYVDGIVEDALIVPVALNYERLVDGNFVREQLGQPKKMETFASTFAAIWSTLRGNYGIVKVNFCQLFSLGEMVKSFKNQQNKLTGGKTSPIDRPLKSTMSSSSLYGTDIIVEEYRQLVDNIGRHIVYDCSSSVPIMSTNIVAFLLLNKFRNGCTLDKLIQSFDFIKRELEIRNKDVAFCGENIDIILHALKILGPGLVTHQWDEITEAVVAKLTKPINVITVHPILTLPHVIELSYYSNTMLTCYVMDSIVVTALYTEMYSQIQDPASILQNDVLLSQDNLIQRSLMLCDILKYEFIFCKPCQDLEYAIVETIRNLSYTDMLILQEDSCLKEELWSKGYAQNFDDSSDEEYFNKKKFKNTNYKLSLDAEHCNRMEFLRTILQPLIETYTLSAFTLRKLIGSSLSERDLIHEVFSEIKTNLERGILSYGESLCVDSIRNSIKLFKAWNILECHSQENIRIFYLKEHNDIDSTITKAYKTIAAFRARNVN